MRVCVPLIQFFLMVAFALASLAGEPLPMPKGEVVLEVYGNIERTNLQGEAHFDREMIEALGTHSIHTANQVVPAKVHYQGPRFSDLLNFLGAKGNRITVTAWDDYVAILDRAELAKHGVLLATHENGKLLTLEDRGPFFVVFPFDDVPELRRDLYYSMSVWQVKSIEVE